MMGAFANADKPIGGFFARSVLRRYPVAALSTPEDQAPPRARLPPRSWGTRPSGRRPLPTSGSSSSRSTGVAQKGDEDDGQAREHVGPEERDAEAVLAVAEV